MLETLEQYSNIALYSAMVVYAVAFVFYVIDFANRNVEVPSARRAAALQTAAVGAAGSTLTLERPLAAAGTKGADAGEIGADKTAAGNSGEMSRAGEATNSAALPSEPAARKSPALRIGFVLTILGFLMHLAATSLRGIAAERLPFANMYEFSLTATCCVVLTFIVMQFFVEVRFLGVLVTGIALLFLGVTRVNYYVDIVPLPAALDTYWLIIHILVAVLAVGFMTISFGLSVLQLMQHRREQQRLSGQTVSMRFLQGLPSAARLEDLSYRIATIGFVFWTFTLIAGAIWAERAWSRYWGWDVKEVWTFVIWVLYAGFIHARATRGWRGVRSAWLSVIAYGGIIFNYTVVNVYFEGLHAYSGL